jgi:predicted RecA/RadA family phage recombinase
MTVARYTDAYRAPGKTLSLAAPYDVTAGAGAKVGDSIFGVAKETLLSGVEGYFETEGEFNLTKVGSQAWAVGERVYWDNSNKRCTTDSAAGMFIGYATVAAGSGAGVTTGTLKLASASEQFEGAQAAVVTLTDSTGQSGTHDDTLAATTVPAALTGGESPTEAEHNAVLTLLGVMVQNQSDVAQKVIEILARLVAAGIIDA